jgi:hypothetical protein
MREGWEGGVRSTCCCDGPGEGRLDRTVRDGQAPSADTAGCKQEQSRSHRGTSCPPAGAGCSYMYSRVLVAGLVTTSRARATAKKEADPRPSRNVTTDSPGRRMCRYWAVKSKVEDVQPGSVGGTPVDLAATASARRGPSSNGLRWQGPSAPESQKPRLRFVQTDAQCRSPNAGQGPPGCRAGARGLGILTQQRAVGLET